MVISILSTQLSLQNGTPLSKLFAIPGRRLGLQETSILLKLPLILPHILVSRLLRWASATRRLMMQCLSRCCTVLSLVRSHLHTVMLLLLPRQCDSPAAMGLPLPILFVGWLGGSDRFLALIMTSVVGPLTLIARLSFRAPALLMDPITTVMGGIPCPGLFEEARRNGLFPDIVDLSLANRPNFRAQMWTWAVSGAPFLANQSADVSVILVDDHDILYLGGKPASLRPSLLASGTISFRTCFSEARIPASFLLKATHATYTTSEPQSRRGFLHYWLLCQSLNGIAAHTFG
ncbi:hypothetical protein K438DRAFT_1842295 [Mycena galopus ATCC 62051]|nr:hypothetical protein K438DRAFT_1842295 [Mycena galopus ATCC 62051]